MSNLILLSKPITYSSVTKQLKNRRSPMSRRFVFFRCHHHINRLVIDKCKHSRDSFQNSGILQGWYAFLWKLLQPLLLKNDLCKTARHDPPFLLIISIIFGFVEDQVGDAQRPFKILPASYFMTSIWTVVNISVVLGMLQVSNQISNESSLASATASFNNQITPKMLRNSSKIALELLLNCYEATQKPPVEYSIIITTVIVMIATNNHQLVV